MGFKGRVDVRSQTPATQLESILSGDYQPRELRISSLPGFVAGQEIEARLGDYSHWDIFAGPHSAGYFTGEEVRTYRRAMAVIWAQETQDHEHPYDALLVDRSEPRAPVWMLSHLKPDQLVRVCDDLDQFLENFVVEQGRQTKQESLRALGKRLPTLYEQRDYYEVLRTTDGLYTKHAVALEVDDPFAGSPLTSAVGHCLNMRGLASLAIGDVQAAIRSFGVASEKCSNWHARVNLAEALCYRVHDYAKAQVVARQILHGEDLWFRKVKVDAYASLLLGDSKDAIRCYRLIHDEYAGLRLDYIKECIAELATSNAPTARDVETWFGITEQVSEAVREARRNWWNELSQNWQRQLQRLVKKGGGTRTPTDDELDYIATSKAFTLYRSGLKQPLKDLVALTGLRRLESVQLNDLKQDTAFFGVLSSLTTLRSVELVSNQLCDLGFVRSLAKLETLNVADNKITCLEPLVSCPNLLSLNIEGNPIVDLAPVATLHRLRELSCGRARHLVSLDHLRGLPLEELRCGVSSITELTFLRSLNSLRRLSIQGSRNLIPETETPSLSETRLSDLAAIGECTALTFLALDFEPNFYSAERRVFRGDIDVDDEFVDDLGFVRKLMQLTTLKLNDAHLKSYECFTHMSKLKSLKLKGGSALDSSLKPLLGCAALEWLELKPTGTLVDLRTLCDLPQLKNLRVLKTAVDRKSVKEFERLRPDVNISLGAY